MLMLDAVAARVVAALVEKDRTTPDSYPLTTKSLVAACNQKTSRDPVTSLTALEVDAALLELRQRGMARTIRGTGDRTFKHRHTLDEALGVDEEELTCLALLVLRGPQTPGELRTRSERYVRFADLAAVEATLGRLAEREDPLVGNTGRGPGQSQDRWIELISDVSTARPMPETTTDVSTARPMPETTTDVSTARPMPETTELGSDGGPGELESLRADVAELRGLVDEIRRELGMTNSSDET